MNRRPPRPVRAAILLRDSATEEGRRRLALRRMTWERQRMKPGVLWWRYSNAFAKGFLITRGKRAAAAMDGWQELQFGPWHVQRDPLLDHLVAEQGEWGVLVLGQAFDEHGPRTRSGLARRMLALLKKSSANPAAGAGGTEGLARSRDQMDETISWLSGRYLILVRRGDCLDVYGDPIATRSCYWSTDSGGVSLASHTELLSRLAGGLPSSRARWVLSHPDYQSPMGKWLPALITPHDGVGQLYANGRLQVSATDEVTHHRFFPRADRNELPEQEVFELFRDEVRQQVRNWTSVAPLTVLTLTAGGDSRAILEAGLVELQRVRALALTYHPFHQARKSTYRDYADANRLAAQAGLRHLVLDVPQKVQDNRMAALYRETFPIWNRYSALTNALYHGAPAKAATLFGVGGAIITGMIQDRTVTQLSPELLARKYAYSRFADDPQVQADFADWIEFTDFSVAGLRGYDFYDFFHWEHRMSKWGATGYSEYDLATIPAPVFSSRRLLTAALSMPWEARRDGRLYRSIRYQSEVTQ